MIESFSKITRSYDKQYVFGSLENNGSIWFTVHFKTKNCQTIPPGTLNMFYIVVIHTDNAKMSFKPTALCQLGGAAINISKSTRNQNQTTLLLPLTSASEICLGFAF